MARLGKKLQADQPTAQPRQCFSRHGFSSAQTEQNPKVKFQLRMTLTAGVRRQSRHCRIQLEFKTSQRELTGIRLEVCPIHHLGAKAPVGPSMEFCAQRHTRLCQHRTQIHWQATLSRKAAATYEQKGWPAQNAIDGKTTGGRTGSGWALPISSANRISSRLPSPNRSRRSPIFFCTLYSIKNTAPSTPSAASASVLAPDTPVMIASLQPLPSSSPNLSANVLHRINNLYSPTPADSIRKPSACRQI